MYLHLIFSAFSLAVILPTIQSDEIYCSDPPVVQFATLLVEEHRSKTYSIGYIANYTCKFGYNRRGKGHSSICRISDSGQNAEWTKPEFSCIPQSCGDPGDINNGRYFGSLFSFPNSVKYECNEGYKLKGLSTRYCQASGSWSGRLPVCEEVTCPKPQNLENGKVTYTTLNYASELQYKCNKGFHLSSDEIVFCTTDGTWSNRNIKCIESVCDMPQQPEYGSVQISSTNGKLLAGTLALFSCDGNRIVDGPTTSKCLENGEWTFPPPNCLEPCKIPYISNGIIGNYVKERYSRRKSFKQKTIDSKIEDDETLYLRCSEGYEILGTDKNEESVSCRNGKWSHELECEAASCRNEPPSGINAQAVALNLEHGGKVLYLCDEDFIKIKNETVICDFGIWKGNPPDCQNTKCFVDDLKFPGLIKGRKSFYKHDEVFEIECDSGYEIANHNRRELRCESGIWKGALPPCVAASCTKPIPEIEHGKAQVRSRFHSVIVKYSCQDPYILIKNSQVQCLFGEWKGEPPKCEDSRCYLKNLKNSAYVDFAATDAVTLSGNKLFVTCKEGYSPRAQRPICLNGKWNENSASPCKESDCEIPMLYHGDITESKLGDYYWNWKKFKYEREMKYTKIPPGNVLPYGSSVMLFCHSDYSFQGTSLKNKRITCSKGQWFPNPVCLRYGQIYVPRTTTQKPCTTTLRTITEQSKAETYTTKMPLISVTTSEEVTLEETYVTPATDTTQIYKENLPKECFCEYPINDENLIAHADEKKLEFKDKVKNGSVVIFRCKHVGYHHLSGVKSIKCENCRKWHSSEFPTCTEPKQGSAVIIFDNTLNVSIEGNLEARKGQDIKFMCVAVESAEYPHWKIPNENRVIIKRERMERETFGDVLYISYLAIENADIENEGQYGCAVGNNSLNYVKLLIEDPDARCPILADIDGIKVEYNMDRRVKTLAKVSCINPGQKIDGRETLICQRNREWSDTTFKCVNIKCKELEGNELMFITYTNDKNVGSKATFHCFAPGQRFGESFALCLENGTWSNPTPICRTPPCTMSSISSILPKNVVPDTDTTNNTVLYNTTIKLTCSGDMIVQSEPLAKCNKKGQWDVGNIQCVPGCSGSEFAKDRNASLLITPHKDIYKLGDMVTFSCPPGMSLTTQFQVIMCLKYGWTETILPDCE